jgi:hypothetical protein
MKGVRPLEKVNGRASRDQPGKKKLEVSNEVR